MAIIMQGSWTVSVKSKNANDDQRFIIAGATVGNGTYAGETVTPPVFITGDQWSLRIENKPNASSPWVSSVERIKFPTSSGGQYRFDVESNDLGPDQDFNDLILTCSMPQTASDYLIYGNVKCYSGLCFFNPCWPRFVVIETPESLTHALQIPKLKEAIRELYPDRLEVEPRPPGPLPDPPPFSPIVLPLQDDTAIPPRLGQVLKVTELEAAPKTRGRKKEAGASVERVSSFERDRPVRHGFEFDRVAVAGIFDHLLPSCDTEILPGYVLRFLEYDRSAAEMAGGAYQGDGQREILGLSVTDVNGNYIFRFSRDNADIVDELNEDVVLGEDQVVQSRPDVIVQLLDSTVPGGVAHESSPVWNVPLLRRFDLCFPCSKITAPSTVCQGNRPLERIGKIRIGIPQTTFDSEGRVTCTDTSTGGIPQARCAAWHDSLSFFACLGSHDQVPLYTVRHRHDTGSGWSDWEYYQESLGIFNVALGKVKSIGPAPANLEVEPATFDPAAQAYLNVYQDNQWATSEQAMKAVVRSWLGAPPYAPQPGSVQFQIQGYDASGNQAANTFDEITLYIDNTSPVFKIDSVSMGSQDGGDCALFHLSGEPDPAPLEVRFKAIHEQGFLQNYTLAVRKGNIGDMKIETTNGPSGETSGSLSNTYVHGSAGGTGDPPCGELFGTRIPDELQADLNDFVTAWVIPQSPPESSNWLTADEPFCTFAVKLSCSKRVTNGFNDAVDDYGPKEYLLGIEKGEEEE